MENIQGVQQKKDRNYSLDLLRILCMIAIVVIHILSHGGLSEKFLATSIGDVFYGLLNSICACAVNVFVLISGYFMAVGKFNIKRLISTVLSVWFYSWLFIAIVKITNFKSTTFEELLKGFLPISFKQYWFATCYICLYLVSPFLNKLMNALDKKLHFVLIVLLFIIFSVWHDLVPLSDPMGLSNGYSFVWFIFLYLLAGFIRLYGYTFKERKKFTYILTFFVAVAIMMVARYVMRFIGGKIAEIGSRELVGHFSRYCSILTVISSISIFMLFKTINIKGKFSSKIIGFIAPLTFGVYLIHDNSNIKGYIFNNLIHTQNFPTSILLFVYFTFAVFAVFFACCLIEFVRKILFNFLEKSKIYNKLTDKLQSKIDGLLTKEQEKGETQQ